MEQKACVSCGRVQDADQFYIRSDSGKLTGECRTCKTTRSSLYVQENRERHRELVSARYYEFGRFARYGLSKDQYETILAMQGHKCALCGTKEPGGKGVWHIDHGHIEGAEQGRFKICDSDAVRGLLCHRCNISVGHYETLLRRLGETRVLDYLTRQVAIPAPLPPVARIGRNEGICSIEGCPEKAKAMGMCASHYRRHTLYGNAEAPAKEKDEYQARGAAHGLAKLDEDAVRVIRASKEKGVVLARRYGVSPAIVSAVRKYRTWRHVV